LGAAGAIVGSLGGVLAGIKAAAKSGAVGLGCGQGAGPEGWVLWMRGSDRGAGCGAGLWLRDLLE